MAWALARLPACCGRLAARTWTVFVAAAARGPRPSRPPSGGPARVGQARRGFLPPLSSSERELRRPSEASPRGKRRRREEVLAAAAAVLCLLLSVCPCSGGGGGGWREAMRRAARTACNLSAFSRRRVAPRAVNGWPVRASTSATGVFKFLQLLTSTGCGTGACTTRRLCA